MIGNSSSGIIEAPYFNIPTVNIGNRQKGREMARSIINTKPIKKQINTAINKGLSKSFKKNLFTKDNPYIFKGGSKKIKDILKFVDLKKDLVKKIFRDIYF